MLTLYLLPGGNKQERTRAAESWSSIPIRVVELNKDVFDTYTTFGHRNSWFAFMYGYEYLDEVLKSALPVLVNTSMYHFFVFYKKFLDHGRPNFSESPRMFRSFVEMRHDGMTPLYPQNRPFTCILDGWVRQDDTFDI